MLVRICVMGATHTCNGLVYDMLLWHFLVISVLVIPRVRKIDSLYFGFIWNLIPTSTKFIAGDVFIPQMINALLQILTLVILSTAMSAYVTPWFLIAAVPVVIVFYLMKNISTVSIRQLKRLENIARSPLLSHVNATSQGLSTIVAYGQQNRFFET